ncbi:Uracil-DNA glycosylase, family 4 [Candidatus Terasakiella magnetica]|uniref:Type-4 uracil-DNA glycosylase n=1 Tax=Candidatus Terasakiella magnetica TaxID=1867952 RepID=A0A1C3RIV5_9PROT|nr:uracil-DNA glycosylase [Candidatus Terasakiella magnetica]SCA57200.1 Uracil-DNA glycosylase, family 4 [Candidatus Terasakiella magnetica]
MNQHSDTTFDDPMNPEALLKWYVEMGVDECITSESVDRYAVSAQMLEAKKAAQAQQQAPQTNRQAPQQAPSQGAASLSPKPKTQPNGPAQQVQATDEMVHMAVELAQNAKNVEQLREAVLSFEGCHLKKTAMNTVFADGNPKADIMFIGEAPATDEDRQGVPFAGDNGKLFDQMLQSCGLEEKLGDRSNVYITNVLFWRPPGNRNPTLSEIAVCLPFLERHIELVDPKMIVLLGGAAAKAVLGHHEGISRLRGRWFTHATPGLSRPAQATALFHPAYLLRSPAQKRRAWGDLLSIVEKLETL